jgi:hypothetical protein
MKTPNPAMPATTTPPASFVQMEAIAFSASIKIQNAKRPAG